MLKMTKQSRKTRGKDRANRKPSSIRWTQWKTQDHALWVQPSCHDLCHSKAETRNIYSQLLFRFPKPRVPRGFQKAGNMREARSGRNKEESSLSLQQEGQVLMIVGPSMLNVGNLFINK